MPDEPKQPSPPQEPPGGTTADQKPPPFDPDYDLITDMERGTKHDVSKNADRQAERRPHRRARADRNGLRE